MGKMYAHGIDIDKNVNDQLMSVLILKNTFYFIETIYSFQGFAWNSYLKEGDFIDFSFEGHFIKAKPKPKTLLLECFQCQSSPVNKIVSSSTSGSCEVSRGS